jgi:hypothetical protein
VGAPVEGDVGRVAGLRAGRGGVVPAARDAEDPGQLDATIGANLRAATRHAGEVGVEGNTAPRVEVRVERDLGVTRSLPRGAARSSWVTRS